MGAMDSHAERDGGGYASDHSDAEQFVAEDGERNLLLRRLPAHVLNELLPELTARPLELNQTLIEPDDPIRDVHFPHWGVCSVIATEQDGGSIEVGTIGHEGFIGLPILLGDDRTPYRTIVQIAGSGWSMPAERFRVAIREHPELSALLLRFVQYYSDQLAQGVACNRLHTIEERCARWLLMTHDRVPGDSFELKQDFLALMLGVRRAGVSVAMGILQSASILRYARGRIEIMNRARLEEVSCACYHITRTTYQRLLG
jgi:CRP-like cAMP-binding protein